MSRRTVLITATVVVVVTATTTTAVMHHRTSSRPHATAAQPASTGDVRTVAQRGEDTFIGTLAAHLCNVSTTVYDDPAALASAYGSVPTYSGLTADQVTAYQLRLNTDGKFSQRLAQQLRTSCHRTK